jgi:predicted nuclease with TOPRIM domain
MHQRHLLRVLFGSVAMAGGLVLPGCILDEMHDEMVTGTDTLEEIEPRLETIETELAELRHANEHLSALRARLELMESINENLEELAEHLASLRATIENVNSVIPFMDIAGDPEDIEPSDAEGDAPAVAAEPDDAGGE